MHIALLGSTGPTGTRILEQALARDIRVTALVRNADRLTVHDPRLTVVVGDATDPDALTTAIRGTDAVLSALGSGRSRSSDVASRAASALVVAARGTGVDRVIWLSALGVGDSVADGNVVQRFIWKAVLGTVFADKSIADRTLIDAALRYTLVYPTTLSNKPDPGAYTAADRLRPGMKPITRAAVAHFMLDQLTETKWVNAIAELAA